jgi:hypothetical protein
VVSQFGTAPGKYEIREPGDVFSGFVRDRNGRSWNDRNSELFRRPSGNGFSLALRPSMRFSQLDALSAFTPGRTPRNISFPGFSKCGLCESNVVLISGRGGVGWAKYGCPLHHRRDLCANALAVRRDSLKRELITGLHWEVLREDVAAYALEEFKHQLQARLARLQEIEQFVQKRLQDIRGLLFADVPRAKAELSKQTLHGNHSYARRIDLPDFRGLEPARRTFGWCRGPVCTVRPYAFSLSLTA